MSAPQSETQLLDYLEAAIRDGRLFAPVTTADVEASILELLSPNQLLGRKFTSQFDRALTSARAEARRRGVQRATGSQLIEILEPALMVEQAIAEAGPLQRFESGGRTLLFLHVHHRRDRDLPVAACVRAIALAPAALKEAFARIDSSNAGNREAGNYLLADLNAKDPRGFRVGGDDLLRPLQAIARLSRRHLHSGVRERLGDQVLEELSSAAYRVLSKRHGDETKPQVLASMLDKRYGIVPRAAADLVTGDWTYRQGGHRIVVEGFRDGVELAPAVTTEPSQDERITLVLETLFASERGHQHRVAWQAATEPGTTKALARKHQVSPATLKRWQAALRRDFKAELSRYAR